MTRKEIITRLTALGFDDPVLKYYDIKDFLYHNRVPIKAITKIDLNDTSGRDSSYWTVLCWVVDSCGNDWGSVEV